MGIESEKQTREIFIERKPLDKDVPNSATIFLSNSGNYHRVYPVYGSEVKCPDGYVEIIALRRQLEGRLALIFMPGYDEDQKD